MPPAPVSETEITKVLSQLLFGDDMRKYDIIIILLMLAMIWCLRAC